MTPILRWFSRWWAVLSLLLAWQLLFSVVQVNELLVPSPTSVLRRFTDGPLDFIIPLLRTGSTALIGLILGVASGLAVASLAWLVPALNAVITPVALAIRSMPFVALIPVLARVLGYGPTTAWVICSLVCFFPTFVLVGSALQQPPPNGNDLFSVAGASRWDRYLRLALPSSMPALSTSIRIAAAISLAAAFIAEFLMGVPGLALVITSALDSFDTTALWAASLTATVVAVSAYIAATRLERTLTERWT